jgi:hypothetical protein
VEGSIAWGLAGCLVGERRGVPAEGENISGQAGEDATASAARGRGRTEPLWIWEIDYGEYEGMDGRVPECASHPRVAAAGHGGRTGQGGKYLG